jgi:hypothetical protein
MRTPILDEFTDLVGLSRQRRYQLRKQRDKLCTECGKPTAEGVSSRCLYHLVKARERERIKRGLKRRYPNTLSYRLEAKAKKGKGELAEV